MSLKTWKNMIKFPRPTTFILLTQLMVVSLLFLTRKKGDLVNLLHQVFPKEEQIVGENDSIPKCDLFSGKWVYDNVSYPLYKDRECSFMEDSFACEKYGRKDLKYQNWRWQPHNCDLPRFNGTALLEKLRGKKLIYVGDSMNRNQWRSMLCLIESYLPPSSKKSFQLTGNLIYFHSIEYNATIGFYWAPMLVESNSDDIMIHRSTKPRVIKIKSIEKHGLHWTDADILVFDSFIWWKVSQITILLRESIGRANSTYKKVEMKPHVYETALNTWAEWLEMHINRTKTKLFFMSISPFRSGQTIWGASHGCYEQTEPIFDEAYWASGADRSMMRVVESTIEKMERRGLKVEYLNITQLSGYREDAHPSIYRQFWGNLTKVEFKDIGIFADCIHWCLPGVPDVWNQFLYSYLMKSG